MEARRIDDLRNKNIDFKQFFVIAYHIFNVSKVNEIEEMRPYCVISVLNSVNTLSNPKKIVKNSLCNNFFHYELKLLITVIGYNQVGRLFVQLRISRLRV
jgi:hypothetical protein